MANNWISNLIQALSAAFRLCHPTVNVCRNLRTREFPPLLGLNPPSQIRRKMRRTRRGYPLSCLDLVRQLGDDAHTPKQTITPPYLEPEGVRVLRANRSLSSLRHACEFLCCGHEQLGLEWLDDPAFSASFFRSLDELGLAFGGQHENNEFGMFGVRF